jgi:hypothetical protein
MTKERPPGTVYHEAPEKLTSEKGMTMDDATKRVFDFVCPTLESRECQARGGQCDRFAVFCNYQRLMCEEHVPKTSEGHVELDWFILPLRYQGPGGR